MQGVAFRLPTGTLRRALLLRVTLMIAALSYVCMFNSALAQTARPTTAPTQANGSLTADELLKAVEGGDKVTVARYLKAGFDVNKRGSGVPGLGIVGGNAVESAAGSGQCEILEQLVAAGGDPDSKKVKFAFTPLNLASGKGHVACVKFLIGRHVRLNVRAIPGGDTALIRAAYQGHIEVVRLLVEAGADMNLSNNDGDTARGAAQVFGNNAIAAYLRSKGGR